MRDQNQQSDQQDTPEAPPRSAGGGAVVGRGRDPPSPARDLADFARDFGVFAGLIAKR